MKAKNLTLAILLLAPTLHAGEAPPIPEAQKSSPDIVSKIKPTVDIRTRYEFREMDGLDASHALTARGRFGLLLGDFSGFSAFGELEATGAAIDDYNGGGGAHPVTPGNTEINDPESVELNQAWLEYKREAYQAKVGRQRIIRNNAAFVGNVGWRQNEQTFDAAQVGYTRDEFSFTYAYAKRVQRIFGNDAVGAAEEFNGDIHLLDASYKTECGIVGGYAYLIDIDNQANVARSNTFGFFTTSDSYRVEVAWQNGGNALANDYDAIYAHLNYTKAVDDSSFGVGFEYLGENFKTPLATVHAFNGFADAFASQRLGLNDLGGRYDGLSDIYVTFSQKGLPGGLVFNAALHHFRDESLGGTYGNEADAVLVKKFNENLTGLLKAAYFREDDGIGAYEDIKQVSVEMDYVF